MDWSIVLRSLAFLSPLLIVFLVAFVLGVANLSRHKGAALLLLLGGVMGGLSLVGSLLVREMLVHTAREQGEGFEKVGPLLTTASVIGNVADAISIGLIVAAVFVGRRPGARREPPRDRDRDDRPRRDRRDDRDDRDGGEPLQRASRPPG